MDRHHTSSLYRSYELLKTVRFWLALYVQYTGCNMKHYPMGRDCHAFSFGFAHSYEWSCKKLSEGYNVQPLQLASLVTGSYISLN